MAGLVPQRVVCWGSSTLQRILHPLRATVAQPLSLSHRRTTSASATHSTVTLPPAIPLAHAGHIPALRCPSLQCTAQQQAPSYRHLQRSRTPAGEQDSIPTLAPFSPVTLTMSLSLSTLQLTAVHPVNIFSCQFSILLISWFYLRVL